MNPWNLSDRENEVMQAIATSGHGSSKLAARDLGLSPKTVDYYVTAAIAKMGVHSRMAAVLTWDRHNRACPHCLAARLEAA